MVLALAVVEAQEAMAAGAQGETKAVLRAAGETGAGAEADWRVGTVAAEMEAVVKVTAVLVVVKEVATAGGESSAAVVGAVQQVEGAGVSVEALKGAVVATAEEEGAVEHQREYMVEHKVGAASAVEAKAMAALEVEASAAAEGENMAEPARGERCGTAERAASRWRALRSRARCCRGRGSCARPRPRPARRRSRP